MKKNFILILVVVLIAILSFTWLRWGPNSWEVQISGTTGDGREIQYRLETVYPGTSKTLIFRNEDAGFFPPYFKFDSANLQALASRIEEQCPEVPVTINGYGWRISFLNMFPNATSIDAPKHCTQASTRSPGSSPDVPLPETTD
ncbi:DUF1523 family protein [Ectothiorhodospira marina]|uniref:Uncharacterized protein n=1 Tax=Ectothiorhodospira marina TaxID=1396821 RepID=A0A1H7NTH4_9GAMM|nr:DUF1523 family protein [Ectothiorhodospira marina]SEL26315.1 Protein of unknown function [Ectothiorhodospira marina]